MQQDNPNQSLLLCCLSALDVDIWAEVLLPKLISQGSAGDVALTCIQLRDLCFGAVQRINLSNMYAMMANFCHDGSKDSSAVEDWMQTIPQHFTGCKCVELYLYDDDSYCTTSYLLPALARLPKLESVKLKVEESPHPPSMAIVLHSLRTQFDLAGGL